VTYNNANLTFNWWSAPPYYEGTRDITVLASLPASDGRFSTLKFQLRFINPCSTQAVTATMSTPVELEYTIGNTIASEFQTFGFVAGIDLCPLQYELSF